MINKKLFTGYLLVILSAFLFGCMPLITTHIYKQGITRESAVLLRNLLALPVLGVLSLIQNKSLKIPVKSLPAISIIALMGCCITPLLLFTAYPLIGPGTTTVFHFIYPAVVVLLGMLLFKKKVSAGTAIAVALCIVGIGLFYDPKQKLDLMGCIIALASGVTYAIYVVLLSVFKYKSISGFRLSFYISLVCAAVMLVVCIATNKLTFPTNFLGWALCILMALVISVSAVVMFQKGAFLIGGERASILSTVEPITGVVTGYFFLEEKMSVGMIIGSVLVIIASILIAVFDAKKKQ